MPPPLIVAIFSGEVVEYRKHGSKDHAQTLESGRPGFVLGYIGFFCFFSFVFSRLGILILGLPLKSY